MNRKSWVWLDSFPDNRKSKIENPKWAGLFAIVVALTVCGAQAQAQQPAKIPRIGELIGGSSASAQHKAFQQGLRELEYVEGKNIVVEWRSAEGKLERLPALATELVRLKVDIIVTAGPIPTRAAKEVTTTIPIVMLSDPDPVANGFVVSLARPGGNITGLATLAPELSGKRLELLKEILPKLSRVAVLGTSNFPGNAQALKEVELAAAAFKVQVQYLDILDRKDIESAFRAASKGRADAVLMMAAGGISVGYRTEIIELALKSRLPVMFDRSDFVQAGGLIAYGVNYNDLARRAATYVDKILKGAKPTDLPVEQPRKFEFIVNLKTAKQIGLTIPPQVLARADRVIK
jgi:putative ABC transport system substrate-binding protein